mmetsp:Transcript_3000/g.6940  ORF Transcript_3000/g.6940 Transcript_3000/m.6940 type:complete len:249 (-) Transcript_3000:2493-3239(-)
MNLSNEPPSGVASRSPLTLRRENGRLLSRKNVLTLFSLKPGEDSRLLVVVPRPLFGVISSFDPPLARVVGAGAPCMLPTEEPLLAGRNADDLLPPPALTPRECCEGAGISSSSAADGSLSSICCRHCSSCFSWSSNICSSTSTSLLVSESWPVSSDFRSSIVFLKLSCRGAKPRFARFRRSFSASRAAMRSSRQSRAAAEMAERFLRSSSISSACFPLMFSISFPISASRISACASPASCVCCVSFRS